MDKSRSPSNLINKETSATTFLRAQYSASAEDKEMIGYFLLFQEMGLPPSVIKKPITDLRVIAHEAQSESENATRDMSGVSVSKIP